MLGIPIAHDGCAESHADKIIALLKEWNIENRVAGLGFDTTAVNPGIRNGVCRRLQRHFGKELINLAFRHHIHEIVLEGIFQVALGKSTGPEIDLFKRFRDEWEQLDVSKLRTFSKNKKLKQFLKQKSARNLLEFLMQYKEKCVMPRGDYKELVELTILLLEGTSGDVKIKKPGACHRARWMAKLIYAIKIFMMCSTLSINGLLKITKAEEEALIRAIHFAVEGGYIEAWFRSPMPAAAARNDLKMIKNLLEFAKKDKTAGNAALCKISSHLWYVSEITVGLAFFDEEIIDSVKRKMVASLQKPGTATMARVDVKDIRKINFAIDHYVTKNTMIFFDALGLPTTTSFLAVDPLFWHADVDYIQARNIVLAVKVVNNVAERQIALMTQFKDSITKSEDMRQALLIAVADHRKQKPFC